MSGFDQPTKLQLIQSCNAVESILDSLGHHTDISLTNRSRILPQVKGLFTSLQRLEEDESKADGAFNTADSRARHNLAGVLTGCGVVASQLRKRINSNALRHDDGLAVELMTLTAEIEEFLKLCKRKPASSTRPNSGTGEDSSALVEDLLRKQQKHESEVEGLEAELHMLYERERTYDQEIATLGAEFNRQISELQNHNDAKLSHIRCLHAAISNLGLRHPLKHQTHEWDDLTDELPSMVQRIENINIKLKELELERDRLKDQEDGCEDVISVGGTSVGGTSVGGTSTHKPSPAANVYRPSAGDKDKDKNKDAKKMREHRRPDPKPPVKVRNPSPTASNTSKSVRRKTRTVNTGAGFFFGN